MAEGQAQESNMSVKKLALKSLIEFAIRYSIVSVMGSISESAVAHSM